MNTNPIIDEVKINRLLIKNTAEDYAKIKDILDKALEGNGLELDEVAHLTTIQNDNLTQELFNAACQVKQKIYGSRIVIFAPLYISNLCANECLYCAFRASNHKLNRKYLTTQEIQDETIKLIAQGHKRILLVAGESYPAQGFDYLLEAINTIYQTGSDQEKIRRINVNVAPLDNHQYRLLKESKIGTYQLFQETYHLKTYQQVHLAGKKADYHWRISAFDRAIKAGIDDVGMGVLFGLANWRFELLALLEHANYLQQTFGVGPHTISVPRIEPAVGSELSLNPTSPVSDRDFCKIVAILRLAIPYTGVIMSTRENPILRKQTLALGVSQISAGSRTNPGGYSDHQTKNDAQFSLGDHRTLAEVVAELASLGYLPSFCTSCYRLGRTGLSFMKLAKSGAIKQKCNPNALITFAEYLHNYATYETKTVGNALIENELAKLPLSLKKNISDAIKNLIEHQTETIV